MPSSGNESGDGRRLLGCSRIPLRRIPRAAYIAWREGSTRTLAPATHASPQPELPHSSITARGVPAHDGGCQCHHSRLETEGDDDVALGVGYNRRLLWPRHVLGHDAAETAERDEH